MTRGSQRVIFVGILLSSRTICSADCNSNGRDDDMEVRAADGTDCNSNDVPDECEFAPLVFGPRGDGPSLSDRPRAAIVADVTGDELGDLVYGSQVSTTRSALAVLVNQGDGTFDDEVVLKIASGLSSIAATDLDNAKTNAVAAESKNARMVRR